MFVRICCLATWALVSCELSRRDQRPENLQGINVRILENLERVRLRRWKLLVWMWDGMSALHSWPLRGFHFSYGLGQGSKHGGVCAGANDPAGRVSVQVHRGWRVATCLHCHLMSLCIRLADPDLPSVTDNGAKAEIEAQTAAEAI